MAATTIAHTARRNAARARIARTRRHVVSDCSRVSDLQHLCGCLPVLRRKEPERPDASRSASRSMFNSICLFSSSFTIVMAERAIARGKTRAVRDLVAADDRAGRDLHPRHGPRVVPPDLRRRPDHQLQPVRDHVLLAGRLARVSRDRRTDRAVDHHDLHRAGPCEAGARAED